MDFTIKPKLDQDSNDLAKEKSAIVRYINRLPKSASPGREEEGESGRDAAYDSMIPDGENDIHNNNDPFKLFLSKRGSSMNLIMLVSLY